jgi:hypothetical protein
MATTSTLVTVRTAIVNLLAAALPTVQVSYSHPNEPESQGELIFLGFAVSTNEVPTMKAGRKRTDERYVQQIIVEVKGEGLTQIQADTRCMELFAEVEDIIADDPNLGIGDTIHWAKLNGWEQVGGSTGTGHGCRIEADVEVYARLN